MGNSQRGSKWNKWDLHVHTPYSFESHYGSREREEVWGRLLSDLEALPTEIKVIGVNDYYFLEGYKKLKTEKVQNGRLKNIDLLLPVIELRLKSFAGNAELKKINFHVIFSDDLDESEIEDHFIKQLNLEHVGPDSQLWKRKLNNTNLIEFGQRIINASPEDKREGFGGGR